MGPQEHRMRPQGQGMGRNPGPGAMGMGGGLPMPPGLPMPGMMGLGLLMGGMPARGGQQVGPLFKPIYFLAPEEIMAGCLVPGWLFGVLPECCIDAFPRVINFAAFGLSSAC